MDKITNDLVAIAARVAAARKVKGITAEELAYMVGKSHSAIARIEQGAVLHIEVGTVLQLADALGARREWLMFGHGEMA